jgi:hypothetical protein
MNVPEQIKAQEKKLQALLDRVDRISRLREYFVGDRSDYAFIGEVFFPQGDTTAQDVVFQIPEDAAYVATRMSIYPAFKFTTTDEATFGPPEVSYRPCVFTSMWGVGTPQLNVDNASLDCFVQLSENYNANGQSITRALQNMPTPVQLFYSSGINYKPLQTSASINTRYSCFEFPTALVFDEDYLLPPGSSITAKVSPSFAQLRVDPALIAQPSFDPSDLELQNEYRITVVLEGYKVMK